MTSRCRSDTAFDVRLSQVDSAFLRAVTKPGILFLLRIIITPGPLMKGLSVSLEKVQDNFRRFGLLDDQVQFLKGWFEDTLPKAPIDRLAILRLDGDMYASTMDALNALYHKVSKGGYVIVDDYNCWPHCKRAIDEFRDQHGIDAQMHIIDQDGVYWQVQ